MKDHGQWVEDYWEAVAVVAALAIAVLLAAGLIVAFNVATVWLDQRSASGPESDRPELPIDAAAWSGAQVGEGLRL